MTKNDEPALLKRIQTDPQAFGILYDEYYEHIFKYAFRRTGDYHLTCDIAAETFLKAFINISKFRWRGISISAWLFRIATNEINYFFRKNKYKPQLISKLKDFNDFDLLRGDATEREELERELHELKAFNQIRQHLKSLDIKYQEVIALRYFENKDNKAISEILGKPEGTIKSLLSRGLEKLRLLVNHNATRKDI